MKSKVSSLLFLIGFLLLFRMPIKCNKLRVDWHNYIERKTRKKEEKKEDADGI
jgi:hypothetical protein